MIADLNVLDLIVAAGQGLFVASFFYFCFLVARHGAQPRRPTREAPWRSTPERTRDAFVEMWQGKPSTGGASKDPRGRAVREKRNPAYEHVGIESFGAWHG